jgi:cysteine-S-conjugate beta-lyase
MEYNFDDFIERRGSDCIKWDFYPEDVIPLWVADMDFKSAEPIIQALRQRVDHGVYGYTRPEPALRRAIRERMDRMYGWHVAEEEILLLPGVVSGLNIAIQAFASAGEAILAQPPVYFHFLRDPVHHGRVLIDPPLSRNGDSYEIDFEQFEKSITNQTRVFILCNPHNPVGRVFSRAELEKIADICLRHRVIICSDEIHCDLIYPGCRHLPIATLSPEVADRTVTLMAPSKTFNVAGLDCGYAIIQNRDLRRSWQNARYALVPGVNIMGQVAALAALREGQDWLDQVIVYLQGNRDFLAEYLHGNLPAIRICRMEATYLAWLDCSGAEMPGNPAEFFLREARVGLNNGPDFGKGGEGFVRLNFACARKTLAEALDRMSAAMSRVR